MSEKGEKTEPAGVGKDAPKNRPSGWATMPSTSAFRAINFELFVKPNKFVMGVGATLFLGSIGYMVYWNLTADSRQKTYVTIDEDGGLTSRPRTSRWE
ncbi:small integral membrane protein 8-like [Babylonia areolata]|uniref:small integral membrane protein 8-like n=1 Tax=Babylonia areolata TaxID=304850 RepID=UPI003FD3C21A